MDFEQMAYGYPLVNAVLGRMAVFVESIDADAIVVLYPNGELVHWWKKSVRAPDVPEMTAFDVMFRR